MGGISAMEFWRRKKGSRLDLLCCIHNWWGGEGSGG